MKDSYQSILLKSMSVMSYDVQEVTINAVNPKHYLKNLKKPKRKVKPLKDRAIAQAKKSFMSGAEIITPSPRKP